MRRLFLFPALGLALLVLALLGSAQAASVPGAAPAPAGTLGGMTAPEVEPELAILQYMVAHNPTFSCSPIGGSVGHRSVGCAVAAGHGATAYVDNDGSPPAAQADWDARRTSAFANYADHGYRNYGSYSGYYARDSNWPYGHDESYFWGSVWVMGATGTDDTQYIRSAEAVAAAVYQAALALGYLGPPPTTVTPTPDPELLVLVNVMASHYDWGCQGPTGTPGHRQISNCHPLPNFSHPTSGYVDNYGSPETASAVWQAQRTNAQNTYPIFYDRDYSGYPGYEAGDTNYPYAHNENYFWGDVRVMGAVSSDDTNFRGSPAVASAIFESAQALGLLPPNPSPTPTGTPPTPTITSTPTRTATPSRTPTATPTPFCEVFSSGSISSCTSDGVYTYSFAYYGYGCPNGLTGTVTFYVGPASGGPWTPYDQAVVWHPFGPPFDGSFTELNIPAPYAWYTIGVSGLPGPSFPWTTPQPICGGTPTATATRTGVATPTPSPTPAAMVTESATPRATPTTGATATGTPSAQPSPSPTGTPTVLCDTFYQGGTTSCASTDVYAYSFNFQHYCWDEERMITIFFEVAPSAAGPWTTYDQVSFTQIFHGYSVTVQGTLTEPGIPANYAQYRIRMYGAPPPAYGGTVGPAPLCRGTPTPCPIRYSDVPETNPFYTYVRCLACRGILSGYADGTFRPYANVTRGQAAKIVANAAGYTETISATQQTFADVPPAQPFWLFVERVAGHGVISGYACGGPGEPCDAQNRPYFRPAADVTRGQLAKITILAWGQGQPVPSGQQTFADVPPTHPFYSYVEQAAMAQVISGYTCGGPGEPCDGQSRPYFRPYAAVTRGQTAKIVANTFFPGCSTPARPR